MAGLLEKLPFGFGLWDMADGNKYTIDDDSTVLTPELAESDAKTNGAYDERYRKQPKKENGGKAKESELREKIKVRKGKVVEEPLNQAVQSTKNETQQEVEQNERVD